MSSQSIENMSFYDTHTNHSKCHRCSYVFQKIGDTPVVSEYRLPVLLKCSHQVCDKCYQEAPVNNDILCKTCKEKASDVAEKNFARPTYLLGHMLMANDLCITDDFPNDQELAENATSSKIIRTCIECTSDVEVNCLQCQSEFCLKCWEEVHSGRESLKRHEKVVIGHENEECDTQQLTCKEHLLPLNSYCQDCELVLCNRCIKFHHKNHISCTLAQQNKSVREDLSYAIVESTDVLEKMKESLKSLQESRVDTQLVDISAELDRVVEWYNRLHGHIQQQEQNILKTMQDYSHITEKEIERCKKTLQSSIDDLNKNLAKAEEALEATDDSCVDFPSLYKVLKDLSQRPCCVSVLKKPNQKKKSVIFANLFEGIFDQLDESIKLVHHPPAMITLVPFEPPKQAPVTNALFDALIKRKVKTEKIEKKGRTNSEQQNSEECSESVKSGQSTRSSRNGMAHYSDIDEKFSEGCTWQVSIVYIGSPHDITVHVKLDKFRIDALQASIEALKSTETPRFFKDGMLLLAPFQKKYYRARVLKIKGDEVSLVFIDYGNRVTLKKSVLKSIDPKLEKEKPLAQRCRLYGCEPVSSSWSPEATKLLEHIIKSSRRNADMIVKRVHQNFLEVELMCQMMDSTGVENVRLSDILLARGLACGTGGNTNNSKKTPRTYFMDQQLLPRETILKMKISSVYSPANFYAYMSREAPSLSTFSRQMSTVYEKSQECGMVLAPYIGMPVAFAENGFWFRGKVTKAIKVNLMEVLKVDFGGTAEMPCENLRRLIPALLRYPPMGYRLCLSNLEPKGGAKWSIEAINTAKTLMLNLTVSVTLGTTETKVPEVFVIRRMGNADVCINQRLIDLNFADSTGTIPSPRTYSVPVSKRGGGHHMSAKRKAALSSLILPEGVKENDMQENEKKAELEVERDSEGRERVEVIEVTSPFCIYLADSTYAKELELLEEKLKETYVGSMPETVDWETGKACVFFSAEKFKWQRGRFLQLLNEYEAKVRGIDTMDVETVALSNLREAMEEEVKNKLLINCYLTGISPPGPKWSGLATEVLNDEIKGAEKVFMMRKGNVAITKSALPVELWTVVTVSDGPLTPLYEKQVSLNEMLVKKGLALPTKSSESQDCLPIKETTEISNKESSMPPLPTRDIPTCDAIGTPVNIIVPSVNQDWLPPKQFNFSSRIIATINAVDERGVLYFMDKHDSLLAERIQEELEAAFQNSRPSPKDHFWEVGQMCSARFHLDNTWHRGKVLKTDLANREYLVLFVDYGNIETCRVQDLRKAVCMPDTPTLAHSCYIGDLRPISGNTYSTEGVDLLHGLLVEKMWFLDIVEVTEGEPFPVTIVPPETYIDVHAILVEKKLAVKLSCAGVINNLPPRLIMSEPASDECEVPSSTRCKRSWREMSSECEPETPKWHGKVIEIPDTVEYCPILIDVIGTTNLVGHLVADKLPTELNDMLEEFNVISEEISTAGPSMPLIQNTEPGTACISIFEDDYYRAVIESSDGDNPENISVYFVDFGNRESVHSTWLYQCKPSWLELPGMAITMQLSGVVPTDKAWRIQFQEEIEHRVLLAKIINRQGSVLEVELLDRSDGSLAYQSLLDCGLFVEEERTPSVASSGVEADFVKLTV